MVFPLQSIDQVTIVSTRAFILTLVEVLDPVNATFDILVVPRLQEHGDRQLVRAK